MSFFLGFLAGGLVGAVVMAFFAGAGRQNRIAVPFVVVDPPEDWEAVAHKGMLTRMRYGALNKTDATGE